MRTTVNESAFRDAFRAVRPDNFSWEGLGILFNYLEELEKEFGEETELDVIALCCDYSEDFFRDIAENYAIDIPEDYDDKEALDAVVEYLNDHSVVCGITANGFIVYCSSF